MLEKAGHRVMHAVNGQEATEMIAAALAGYGGRARHAGSRADGHGHAGAGRAGDHPAGFRELEELAWGGRRVPILALTANVRHEDHATCIAAGMDGHLPKPFDRSDLEAAIAKLSQARSAA